MWSYYLAKVSTRTYITGFVQTYKPQKITGVCTHLAAKYLDIDLELMAKLVCHQPASVQADVPVNTSSFRNGTVCQVSW